MQVTIITMQHDTYGCKMSKLPLKLNQRINNTQLTPQSNKATRNQRFRENISNLRFRLNKLKHNDTLFYMVSKEVIPNIIVLSPRILNMVFSNIYSISVIAQKWNTTKL